MNVTETSAEGLKREFKITIPANEVEDKITKRLDEVGRMVRIPGFRPGKVPLPLLRKRYGAAVRGEVLESAVQDSSAEAIRERNLRPALPPRYRAGVERRGRRPRIHAVARGPAGHAGAGFRRARPRKAGGAGARRGYREGARAIGRVAAQIGTGRASGRERRHRRRRHRRAYRRRRDPRQPRRGPRDRARRRGVAARVHRSADRAQAGEQREVKVTFPPESGPEMAGKEGVFQVSVKEVRHRLPAAIDDTLAEAVGLESLDELRQEIRQRMQRDYDNVARQRLKRALLDKLAERYDFPVPPGMVDMEFATIWAQYEAERDARRQIAARAAENRSEAERSRPAGGRPMPARSTPAMSSRRRKPRWRVPRIARRRPPRRKSRPSTRPMWRVTTRSRIRGPASEPIDAAAIIAPEETALEGASDTEPARPRAKRRTTRRTARSSAALPSAGSAWGCCLPRSVATTIYKSARRS